MEITLQESCGFSVSINLSDHVTPKSSERKRYNSPVEPSVSPVGYFQDATHRASCGGTLGLADGDIEGDLEGDLEGDRLGDELGDELGDDDGESEAEGESEGLSDGDNEELGLTEALGLSDGDVTPVIDRNGRFSGELPATGG